MLNFSRQCSIMYALRYSDLKIILRMGGLHVIICLLRTIYSRFKDSRMIEILSSSGPGGESSIAYALKGGIVKFDTHLHKKLYEALIRTKINDLLKTDEQTKINVENFKPTVTSLRVYICEQNLKALIGDPNFQPLPKLQGDMSEWVESYLEMVDLLNIIHFQRIGNWEGYLQCLNEFLPYCFACNRHKYARNMSFYYIQMLHLKTDKPKVDQFLMEKGFTASLSGNPRTKIPIDQVIGMTINRTSKDTGGISGKTQNTGH